MEVNSEFAYILPNERKSKNVHFPGAGSNNKRHPRGQYGLIILILVHFHISIAFFILEPLRGHFIIDPILLFFKQPVNLNGGPCSSCAS